MHSSAICSRGGGKGCRATGGRPTVCRAGYVRDGGGSRVSVESYLVYFCCILPLFLFIYYYYYDNAVFLDRCTDARGWRDGSLLGPILVLDRPIAWNVFCIC